MNLIYDTLLRVIPGAKRKHGASGWTNFNAICCTYNGEIRPDTRNRGGLRLSSDNACVYHCFNCKYTASWTPGHNLSKKMEHLLDWAHVSIEEQKRIKFKVWQLWMNSKSDNPVHQAHFQANTKLTFPEVALPDGAKPFSHWLKPENFNPNFAPIAQYMLDRGEDLFDSYEFYWTPTNGGSFFDMNQRVIIPFRWEGKTVGFTGRDTTGKLKHRYYGLTPANYIFNTESIDYDNEYIFVCEGSFDALAINGVAMLGDKVSAEQAAWLNNTGKKIVIIPDREKFGGKLVDIAIAQGWMVSFPKWGDNMRIKDAAQAVKDLGKLYTMLSISDAIVSSKLEINTRRRKLVSRVQ